MAICMTAKEAAELGISPKRRQKKIKHPETHSWLPPFMVSKAGNGIVIELPGVPPSLNRWSNLHWREKGEDKADWENTIIIAVRGIKQFSRPVVRITYCFDTMRRRDKDNYTPKFIMDGLTKAGVIADDNSEAVDLDWDIVKGNKRITRIMIKEADQ